MAPEFQKIMDKVLHKKTQTFSFIDDILIVTKGSNADHLKEVEDTIKALDNAGIRIKLEKCNIAKKKKQNGWGSNYPDKESNLLTKMYKQ